MTGEGVRKVEARTLHGAHFRYFDFIMVAFVVVLLLSNVIGAVTGCVSSVNWAPVGLPSSVMVAVLGEMTSRCVEVRPRASRAVSVRA